MTAAPLGQLNIYFPFYVGQDFFPNVQETKSLQSQQQIIKVRWFWSFASHGKKNSG